MRFTCLKTIVTKVFDGILEDSEDINNTLQMIKEKELTISMQVKKGPVHEFVRILNLDENRITWRILKGRTSLQKTSDISDIMSVKINTNDELKIHLKPNPSRWSTLDI